jgi:hypothetical protein
MVGLNPIWECRLVRRKLLFLAWDGITLPTGLANSRNGQRKIWVGYGFPLVLYLVLAIGLTWPLVQYFTTQVIGFHSPQSEVQHNVWFLYHVKEALFLRDGLFYTSDLYYPEGISLLLHGLGPVSGVFALPFWIWGPEAAYNGVILVGLILSPYCMYLLARALGIAWDVALFSGIVLQLMPIHLGGIFGHLTKTFIGLLPIVMLVALHAFNVQRNWTWCLLVGLTLVGTALHSGYQFVYAALAVAALAIWSVVTCARGDRKDLVLRIMLAFGSAVAMVGPLLLAILQVANSPGFEENMRINVTSSDYAPDLVQVFIPSAFQRTYSLLMNSAWGFETAPTWYRSDAETFVTIPWTVLVLCLVALVAKMRLARVWLVIAFLCVLLALGPYLRVFGHTKFTDFEMPIVLPYAFLVSLPGLEFMRASGRFMMMACVPLGIGAAFGLVQLMERRPQWRACMILLATALLLGETWPSPWPHAPLPVPPAFYQDLGKDGERYGVLDLPFAFGDVGVPTGWPTPAGLYQMYQMSHHKPIAYGYLSRTYRTHPVPVLARLMKFQASPRFLIMDGEPAPQFTNAQAELADSGYRYVVWHKTLWEEMGGEGPDEVSTMFIRQAFGDGPRPEMEDEQTRVFAVDPNATPTALGVALGEGWYGFDQGVRWAASPATLDFEMPRAQSVTLELIPKQIHDAESPNGLGSEGLLTISVGEWSAGVPIKADVPTSVTVPLEAGSQTVRLTLADGSFRPSDIGIPDDRVLSFALQSINITPID